MPNSLRQIVLFSKANVSDDCGFPLGQSVLMDKPLPQRKYLEGFLGRTTAARKLKFDSGKEMAEALGWGEDQQPKYSKYESRSSLPVYLIPQFCMICGVTIEWLVAAKGPGPAWQPVDLTAKKTRKKPKKPSKRAA